MTAVLLVGGMGTRLRPVLSGTPKPLAPMGGGCSFLELLVRQLRHQGISHLVMCSGYLADQIERTFGSGAACDVTIDYSRENEPLGTAGALGLSRHYLEEDTEFFVLNGDSFLDIDFHELIRFHREHGGLASMAVVSVRDTARYGTVLLDSVGRVVNFVEKASTHGPGLINAGVYVFNRAILDYIPKGPSSLEKDVFPLVMNRGIYAFQQSGMFIDIGTPEDYERAKVQCDRLCEAAFRK